MHRWAASGPLGTRVAWCAGGARGMVRLFCRSYGREEKPEPTITYEMLKGKIDDLENFKTPPPWDWVQRTIEHTETHYPKDHELLFKLGTVVSKQYTSKKSKKYALRLIRQGLAYAQPESAKQTYARLHLELRNYDEAMEVFQELLEKNPKCMQSLHGVGTILAQQEQYRESIRYFLKALAVEPQSITTLLNLASAYFAYGKFESSLAWIEKAKKIDPDNPLMYLNLGDLYTHLKQEDKALEQYLKAVEISPDNADTYCKLAELCLSQQKLEEAASYLDKAIEKDPTKSDYYHRRADLCMSMENKENPFPFLHKALEMNPYNPDTLTHLGIASEFFSESEAALKYFNTALQYDPDHVEARINLGTLYNSMRAPKKALETVLPLRENKDVETEYLEGIIKVFQEAVQDEEDKRIMDKMAEE